MTATVQPALRAATDRADQRPGRTNGPGAHGQDGRGGPTGRARTGRTAGAEQRAGRARAGRPGRLRDGDLGPRPLGGGGHGPAGGVTR
jgi:hypothetical protein